MPATDLCTLAQVKAFVPNAPATADDVTLSQLITAASQSILSDLQRATVLSRSYTDRFDGYGDRRKMLRHFPVTSVASVLVGPTSIPLSTGYQSGSASPNGYALEPWDGELPGKPQMLDLIGYEFCWGAQNVTVVYTAGYLVSAEAAVVAANQVTALQQNGPWAQAASVTYANGTPLVQVASNPAVGQYAVSAGVYSFNAADNGAAVLLGYSYVPAPLNQAAIEVTAEAYRYRTRIGEKSHAVPGPQTVGFDLSRATAAVRWMTQPYKMVVPLL